MIIAIVGPTGVGKTKLSIELAKRYGIDEGVTYDKIVFGGANKAKVCKEENIDLFIDDSPVTCQLVKESGVDVIAFKSKITAYAIDKSGLPSVSSWNELYQIINK